MSDPQKPIDPFDPVAAAFGALHNQNLLAAKDAEIARLKAEVAMLHADIERWSEAGELMLDHINSGMTAEYRVIGAINAAKEGRHS